MKTKHPLQNTLRLLPLAALAFALCSCGKTGAQFTVSKTGSLQNLGAAGAQLAFAEGGGFFARDAKTDGAAIDFSKGTLEKNGSRFIYKSDGERGISLSAEFVPMDGYIQVNGELQNAGNDDRAIILDYRVKLDGKDVVFSNSLNAWEDAPITGVTKETEGNAFPVAAVGAPGKPAVAVAIPWNAPRTFGVVGADNALSMRFYLGITPLTKAFPNKASFSFIIYPSRASWGFRGALEKYYSFYPDRYEPKRTDVGFHMSMVKGLVPENVADYAYNMFEIHHPDADKDLARDDKYNIASEAYTIVGQREIKFLPEVPKDYDDAMKAFANWKLADHQKHTITKENIASDGDKYLREEVESSGTYDADGNYNLSRRNTPWGKNSVSFKINPSPYLFADKPEVKTVGKDSTELAFKWMADKPKIDGILVDSLGANWPAVANYRHDHIAYAQYPVTFDPQGRLFLHNQISHYEWVRYMHERLAPKGKLLSANGLYAYMTSVSEHYRAKDRRTRIKVGRFFIASMLDNAVSEAGIHARTDRCQDTRLMMGRKYYALTNYDWENEENVRKFYNRSLAYGVFASNTKNYFGGGEYIEFVHEGTEYVNHPRGYYRDKALLAWFLPKARMLFKAGWQPATLAVKTVGDKKVFVERFGAGDTVYFTVFNDSEQNASCSLKLDLDSLGFGAAALNYEEVSYAEKLATANPGEVSLDMEPYKTYIIKVTRL